MSAQQWMASFLMGGIEEAYRRGFWYTFPFVLTWPLSDCLAGEWEDE